MVARSGLLGVFGAQIAVGLCLAAAVGCASPARDVKAPDDRAEVRRKQSLPREVPAPSAARLELSVDEELMSARLKKTAGELCALGERNHSHPWELADAAEYVAHALGEMGAPSRRYTVEQDGVVYHSFVLGLGVEGAPFEVVAFYDSEVKDSGRDPAGLPRPACGALGAAMALELARIFVPARLEHSLRLVLSARSAPGLAANSGYLPESLPLGRLVLGEGLGESQLTLGWSGAPGAEWPNLLVAALGEPPLEPKEAAQPVEAAQEPLSLTVSGRSLAVDNFDLAAVRISQIRGFLATLLGEKPTNDQMLTPL
jgi:hypothetical protein